MKSAAIRPEPAVTVGATTFVVLARTELEAVRAADGFVLRATKAPVEVVVDTGRERFVLDLEGGRRPVDEELERRSGD